MPEWITLSKFLPQLVYPFNLALWLLLAALTLFLFRYRRSAIFSVFLATVVLAVCASPLSVALFRQHENQYPAVPLVDSPVVDAIVLLGGDVGIPSPPRVASQLGGNRLLHAYRLYRAGKAPLIVITGGNVFAQDGVKAEAHYSAEILASWGVPEESIITETQSRNTRQNALNSHQILTARGLDKILLVTSAFHMPRAAGVFRHVGFNVAPSPAGFSVTDYRRPAVLDWWPSLGNLGKAQALAHEKLGILVYRLRDWID